MDLPLCAAGAARRWCRRGAQDGAGAAHARRRPRFLEVGCVARIWIGNTVSATASEGPGRLLLRPRPARGERARWHFNELGWVRGCSLPLTQSVVLKLGVALSPRAGRGRINNHTRSWLSQCKQDPSELFLTQ